MPTRANTQVSRIPPDRRFDLPEGLPVPVDDGACDHLSGARIPTIGLEATDGTTVDLSSLAGRSVVFAYPRTGLPTEPVAGGWDAIPGARGCTPHACGFRDHYAALTRLGARIFGLSTQTPPYQREAAGRLGLPFALLSDCGLKLTRALGLPTFTFEPYAGESPTHLRRLALIMDDGVIVKVFYPIFPPDRNAADVVAWLEADRAR